MQNFLQTESQVVNNLNVMVMIKAAGALALPSMPAAPLAALQTLVTSIDQLSAAPRSLLIACVQRSKRCLTPGTRNHRLEQSGNAGPASGYAGRLAAECVPYSNGNPNHHTAVLVGVGRPQRAHRLYRASHAGSGFGTVADYLRCLLWGFGLPVAGQGLQTLTMSSVNTQLGVTLPK